MIQCKCCMYWRLINFFTTSLLILHSWWNLPEGRLMLPQVRGVAKIAVSSVKVVLAEWADQMWIQCKGLDPRCYLEEPTPAFILSEHEFSPFKWNWNCLFLKYKCSTMKNSGARSFLILYSSSGCKTSNACSKMQHNITSCPLVPLLLILLCDEFLQFLNACIRTQIDEQRKLFFIKDGVQSLW